MVRTCEHEARLPAPRERVWQVLTDFGGYHAWNPFLWNAAGEARMGERVLLQMQPPGGNPMRFSARIEQADGPRELRWAARLLHDALFRAEFRFRLEPARDGVRLIQSAHFSGRLAGWVPSRLYERQQRGLAAMAEGLHEHLAAIAGASA